MDNILNTRLILIINVIFGLYVLPVSSPAADKEKPVGAGAEYDGIVLSKESEPAVTKMLKTTVTVDEKNVIRSVNQLLFGYNHDGPSDNFVLFNDNKINDSVVELCKDIPMPLNRIQAFGYNENTRWKRCIGSFADRQPVQMTGWEKSEKKAYGPVEAVDFCLRVDPKAKFTWCVNIKSDTPDDTADLVEFLTGDGSKPRGEKNWAKLRIAYGLPNPVPVAIWEMSNEVDWANPPKRMSVNEYIERCKKHIAAIRGIDPDAKIALHAASAPWAYRQRFNEDWRDWHRTILKQLGPEIDYISFHPYYSGNPVSYVEMFLDTLRDDIAASSNPKIKIFISEHATWPPNIDKKDTWHNVQTLSSALAVSHFLSRLLVREEVGAATYHCFTHGGGLWGLLDVGKAKKERFTTAFADLFKMLSRGLGDNVVRAAVSGDRIPLPGNGEKTFFVATAMTTKDGLNLLLVNREPAASRTIDFTLNYKYALTKETVFTAPAMNTYNTESVKNTFVTEKPAAVEDFHSYIMPPKSVVILTLRRI